MFSNTHLWYKKATYIITFFFVIILLAACKKDSFITSSNATLLTSVDTLKFDTVFTSIGSVTQQFTITNNNSSKLQLSSVKLMGGQSSAYKININGLPQIEAANIDIAANDSMYIFVTVNINPNLNNLAFVVQDSIQIIYNGNTKYVQLEAFGQNANFLRSQTISSNRTFFNNLPYVILGNLRVDTNVILTIQPGCKIYAHANAPILIDGTLLINATAANPVIFSGDRLDEGYKDLPASWPGIYFRGSSKNNVLQFVTVKNAYQAIVVESPASNANPKIMMQQCIVDNAYATGIFGINTSIQANNCLVSNCGSNIDIQLGGNYNFTNCTVAAYTPFFSHKNPVLSVNNFATINGTTVVTDIDAAFINCIFWGESSIVKNEVIVNKLGNTMFSVALANCLYKAENDPENTTITNCIKNSNPIFDSTDNNRNVYDFKITKNLDAPGIDKGKTTLFFTDLSNNTRAIGQTDIGCYEKQ